MVHMGYGQKQATYGRGFDRKYEGVKASAESKKPDISWHFAIVSFGSINIEGCVPRAALLRKIYFQVHDLSQIGSLGTCTRHGQEAESISHSDLSSA